MEDLSAIKQEVNKEIEEAFVFAKNSPFPKPEQLEQYVYH